MSFRSHTRREFHAGPRHVDFAGLPHSHTKHSAFPSKINPQQYIHRSHPSDATTCHSYCTAICGISPSRRRCFVWLFCIVTCTARVDRRPILRIAKALRRRDPKGWSHKGQVLPPETAGGPPLTTECRQGRRSEALHLAEATPTLGCV